MKYVFMSLLFLWQASFSSAPPSGYQIVWADEFDVDYLNPRWWNVIQGPFFDAQQGPEAVFLDDGILSIKTHTRDGLHYTGYLTTTGLVERTFGYYESRIRFHTSPAQWCAFWLQPPGQPAGDAKTGGVEVDIVEHRSTNEKGRDISNIGVMNLHWDGYGKNHKSVGSWEKPAEGSLPLQDGWHTYGVHWTPEKYVFYLDGVQTWETSRAVSQIPQDIRLTCAIRDVEWAGNIPEDGYGDLGQSLDSMDVDCVRVWQLNTHDFDTCG